MKKHFAYCTWTQLFQSFLIIRGGVLCVTAMEATLQSGFSGCQKSSYLPSSSCTADMLSARGTAFFKSQLLKTHGPSFVPKYIQKNQLRIDFTTEPLRHPYTPSIATNEIQCSRFSTSIDCSLSIPVKSVGNRSPPQQIGRVIVNPIYFSGNILL